MGQAPVGIAVAGDAGDGRRQRRDPLRAGPVAGGLGRPATTPRPWRPPRNRRWRARPRGRPGGRAPGRRRAAAAGCAGPGARAGRRRPWARRRCARCASTGRRRGRRTTRARGPTRRRRRRAPARRGHDTRPPPRRPAGACRPRGSPAARSRAPCRAARRRARRRRSKRPRRSTPDDRSGRARRATDSSTDECSTAVVTTWPPGERASAPHTAAVTASVPPEVSTTSRGRAPNRAAICSRACSMATRTVRPSWCRRPGSAAREGSREEREHGLERLGAQRRGRGVVEVGAAGHAGTAVRRG